MRSKWNLTCCGKPEVRTATLLVNGVLLFFSFSGIDLKQPQMYSCRPVWSLSVMPYDNTSATLCHQQASFLAYPKNIINMGWCVRVEFSQSSLDRKQGQQKSNRYYKWHRTWAIFSQLIAARMGPSQDLDLDQRWIPTLGGAPREGVRMGPRYCTTSRAHSIFVPTQRGSKKEPKSNRWLFSSGFSAKHDS